MRTSRVEPTLCAAVAPRSALLFSAVPWPVVPAFQLLPTAILYVSPCPAVAHLLARLTHLPLLIFESWVVQVVLSMRVAKGWEEVFTDEGFVYFWIPCTGYWQWEHPLLAIHFDAYIPIKDSDPQATVAPQLFRPPALVTHLGETLPDFPRIWVAPFACIFFTPNYVDETFPSKHFPPSRDSRVQDMVRQVIDKVKAAVAPIHHKYMAFDIDEAMCPSPDTLATAAIVAPLFQELEALLQQSGGRYCVGETLTRADAYLVPACHLARLWNITGDFCATPFPRIDGIMHECASHRVFTDAYHNIGSLLTYYLHDIMKAGRYRPALILMDYLHRHQFGCWFNYYTRFKTEFNNHLGWVLPSRPMLETMSQACKHAGAKGVVSICCGTGMSEGLLQWVSGLKVTGVEDFSDHMGNPDNMPHRYIQDIRCKRPGELHPIASDQALLISWGRNGHLFCEYVLNYPGDVIIVVGEDTKGCTFPADYLADPVGPAVLRLAEGNARRGTEGATWYNPEPDYVPPEAHRSWEHALHPLPNFYGIITFLSIFTRIPGNPRPPSPSPSLATFNFPAPAPTAMAGPSHGPSTYGSSHGPVVATANNPAHPPPATEQKQRQALNGASVHVSTALHSSSPSSQPTSAPGSTLSQCDSSPATKSSMHPGPSVVQAPVGSSAPVLMNTQQANVQTEHQAGAVTQHPVTSLPSRLPHSATEETGTAGASPSVLLAVMAIAPLCLALCLDVQAAPLLNLELSPTVPQHQSTGSCAHRLPAACQCMFCIRPMPPHAAPSQSMYLPNPNSQTARPVPWYSSPHWHQRTESGHRLPYNIPVETPFYLPFNIPRPNAMPPPPPNMFPTYQQE
eukprot:gene4135-754_t